MEVEVIVSSDLELSNSSSLEEEEEPAISSSQTSNLDVQLPVVLNPWPFLEDFFKFVEEKGQNNLIYQCQLCKPLIKKLSTSKKSQNNLKKHIERLHPNKKQQYQNVLNNSRKRRYVDGSVSGSINSALIEPSAKKAAGSLKQTKITSLTNQSKQNDFEQKVS